MSLEEDNAFLVGECISIFPPTQEDFGEWAAWFNSSEVTRYLPQGLFPSSSVTQEIWYRNEIESGRFIGMIRCNVSGSLLGVASLSEINFQRRSAQASFVVPRKSASARYPALEARALVTQHAFLRMGLSRLWSGQVFPGNRRWTEAQSIVGWFLEGFEFDAFSDGARTHDVARTSIARSHFFSLADERGGQLWPGQENCASLLAGLAKSNYSSFLDTMHESLRGLAQR